MSGEDSVTDTVTQPSEILNSENRDLNQSVTSNEFTTAFNAIQNGLNKTNDLIWRLVQSLETKPVNSASATEPSTSKTSTKRAIEVSIDDAKVRATRT